MHGNGTTTVGCLARCTLRMNRSLHDTCLQQQAHRWILAWRAASIMLKLVHTHEPDQHPNELPAMMLCFKA